MEEEKDNFKNYYEELKKIKTPFTPKFGFSLGAGFTIDKKIIPDINISMGFQYYFLKYFYVGPELYLKPYQDIGVGVGVRFGLLF